MRAGLLLSTSRSKTKENVLLSSMCGVPLQSNDYQRACLGNSELGAIPCVHPYSLSAEWAVKELGGEEVRLVRAIRGASPYPYSYGPCILSESRASLQRHVRACHVRAWWGVAFPGSQGISIVG